MKLTLLGTGGPIPDPTRHGSAAALEVGGARLLFDAGRGVVLQMTRAGIPVEEVGPVFVTHHHYDHIGDLADVILTGWLQGRRRPLRVVGPPGTESIACSPCERNAMSRSYTRSSSAVTIDSVPGGPTTRSGRRRPWSQPVRMTSARSPMWS